jgi:RPA family protein
MAVIRKREVARRVFAKEFNDSTHLISENDDKSPVYVLTPLGLRCNRIFIVGALLEKEEVRPDSGIWRIRIADPTGSFVGYIGKYQPEALESLVDIEPPALVSVAGKVRIFEGTSKNLVFIRPEMVSLADTTSRDYWVIETARSTLKRIEAIENSEDEDARLAIKIYSTNIDEYKKMVKDALLRLKEEYEVFERIEEELEEEEGEEQEEEFEFELEEEEWDLSDLLED